MLFFFFSRPCSCAHWGAAGHAQRPGAWSDLGRLRAKLAIMKQNESDSVQARLLLVQGGADGGGVGGLLAAARARPLTPWMGGRGPGGAGTRAEPGAGGGRGWRGRGGATAPVSLFSVRCPSFLQPELTCRFLVSERGPQVEVPVQEGSVALY